MWLHNKNTINLYMEVGTQIPLEFSQEGCKNIVKSLPNQVLLKICLVAYIYMNIYQFK